jgi:hypothetical protein
VGSLSGSAVIIADAGATHTLTASFAYLVASCVGAMQPTSVSLNLDACMIIACSSLLGNVSPQRFASVLLGAYSFGSLADEGVSRCCVVRLRGDCGAYGRVDFYCLWADQLGHACDWVFGSPAD